MTANESLSPASTLTTKHITRLLAGAALGAAAGWGWIQLLQDLHVPFKGMPWADLLALVIGLVFLLAGVVTVAISANRKELAATIEGNYGDAMPATNEEVRSYRRQGLTLALAGILLMVPVVSQGYLKAHPGAALALYVGVVALYALQTLVNYLLWKGADEFLRVLMLRMAAISFAVGQGLLFLWAAAEKLRLARAVSSWEIVTLLLTGYMLLSVMFAFRYQRR
jgi:hypothetical protein